MLSFWQKKSLLSILLLPLSFLYCAIVIMRRFFYQQGWFKSYGFAIPIIIVGNITVGGNGKTPMVIWLARFLKNQGFNVGIVSRGYGRKTKHSIVVDANKTPDEVGDEPLLIYQSLKLPVIVDRNRVQGVKDLIEQFHCNVIIADDGLQHYRLKRSFEIIMIHGAYQLGNALCLPSGPLREPKKRLDQANILIYHDKKQPPWFTEIIFSKIIHLQSQKTVCLTQWQGKTCHAVAAIAHPESFFAKLKQYGINVIPHAFTDHYFFKKDDLDFKDNYPILMTAKDAVKCQTLVNEKHWYIVMDIKLPPLFEEKIIAHIKEFYDR